MTRTLFAALALALTLTACADDQAPEPAAVHTIDRDAWTADLVAVGGRSTPDLDTLEANTRETCAADAAYIALYLAQDPPTVSWSRVNFTHVCPDRLDVFDEALRELDRSTGYAERICNTPIGQLSAHESEDVDTICW